jgi:hypothetical protein
MSTLVRRALYGQIASDTTLWGDPKAKPKPILPLVTWGGAPAGYTKPIYHTQAPEDAGFPLIIFSKSSGVPTGAFGAPTALDNEVWMVKAVDRSTTADGAEAIATRTQALLNDAPLSISGATTLYLRRESDIEYVETTDGVTYQHVGSLYRLITTPTP